MPIRGTNDDLELIDVCNVDAGLRGEALDMAARLDIAIDVAHAITYLHMYTGKELIVDQGLRPHK